MNTITGRSGTVGAPDPRPRFPEDRGGVAIPGCGTVAQSAHLPVYEQYDVGGRRLEPLRVDSGSALGHVRERVPFVGRVYDDVENLLADP